MKLVEVCLCGHGAAMHLEMDGFIECWGNRSTPESCGCGTPMYRAVLRRSAHPNWPGPFPRRVPFLTALEEKEIKAAYRRQRFFFGVRAGHGQQSLVARNG